MKKQFFLVAILAAALCRGISGCKGGKTQDKASADTTAVAKDTAKTDSVVNKADTVKAKTDSVKNKAGNEIDELISQYERKVVATERALRKAFNGKITDKALNSVSNKCLAATRHSEKLAAKQNRLTAAQKKKVLDLDARMRDIINGLNDYQREQMMNSGE